MSRAGRGVLLDGDVLGCVWGFVLGGSGRQDVCVLGQLSVVCRKWRAVSSREAWWGRIAEDMLPLLWEEEQEGQAGSSRGRVVQYGRFLKGQRELAHIPHLDNAFLEGLEGHVEVFDRMDGLQMFSMRGAVSFTQHHEYLTMKLSNEGPRPSLHVEGAAFSAASRAPLGMRLTRTVRAYFTRGNREEYPCCLCIRVTLRDTRTGRMAVVWAQDNLTLNTLSFSNNGFDCHTTGGRPREIPIGRLVCPLRAHFGVRRVEDQGEGVSAQDRLYRIQPARNCFSVGFHSKLIGDSDEGQGMLTLEHFILALQAVMTPASRHGGVRAARS
jgi:hypothetical protein